MVTAGFALFLFVCGVLAVIFGVLMPKRETVTREGSTIQFKTTSAKWTILGGIITIALAFILLLTSTLVQVSTKNVGVETTFGKPSGELSNGLHLKWPWEKVTEMDAAIQTDTYVKNDCFQVRIANQQTACVHINFQWRINPAAAQELFRDYRTFDHVREALVTRRLTAVVNEQLANYNPLNSVAGSDLPPGEKRNPTLAVIAKNVNAQMTQEIGGKDGSIEVLSTIIPLITFDPETQGRINQLQQQVALTRVARQSQRTAEAQALANKKLAASVSNAPNVLVSHCYSILETMVKNGQPVPAGFSCWPGGKLAGVIAAPASGK